MSGRHAYLSRGGVSQPLYFRMEVLRPAPTVRRHSEGEQPMASAKWRLKLDIERKPTCSPTVRMDSSVIRSSVHALVMRMVQMLKRADAHQFMEHPPKV